MRADTRLQCHPKFQRLLTNPELEIDSILTADPLIVESLTALKQVPCAVVVLTSGYESLLHGVSETTIRFSEGVADTAIVARVDGCEGEALCRIAPDGLTDTKRRGPSPLAVYAGELELPPAKKPKTTTQQ